MHNYFLYNFLMFFYMYSVMVLTSVHTGSRPLYYSDVVRLFDITICLFRFVFIIIMPTKLIINIFLSRR